MLAKFSLGVLVQLCLLASSQVFAQEDALSIKDFKLTIEAADGSTVSSASGSYPGKVLSKPQVPHTQTIQASFSVKKGGEDFKAQQVMLMLTSQVTGVSAYAVAKAKKDGGYTVSINAASVEKQLGKQDGMFTARLLVGDASASSSVSWELGQLELLLAPGSGTAPENAVRTAAFQPVNNIKPEIVHMFRAPDKRAPAVVSLAFTGLAVAPLVFVVLYVLGGIGANFKGFPIDGTTRLAAMIFHGSIGSMLFLYYLFWVKLNLAQTLPLVLAIGAVVALSGYKTLSGLASARLKKD